MSMNSESLVSVNSVKLWRNKKNPFETYNFVIFVILIYTSIIWSNEKRTEQKKKLNWNQKEKTVINWKNF